MLMKDKSKTERSTQSSGSGVSGNSYLLVSQMVFLLCGYGIQIMITRFLTPEDYGTWGLLTAVLIWFELTIISGFPKGVTKFIAAAAGSLKETVYYKSYFVQLAIGLFLGAFFYLLAYPFSLLWNNSELILLFKISALDIPIYGLYFENMAVLNGKHQFRKMFLLQSSYSISKLILIVVLVVNGYGLVGAAWGNVLASLAAFIVSQCMVGIPRIASDRLFSIKTLIAFCIPSTVFVILFALLQRIDFLFLKVLSKYPSALGYYFAAQLLAKIPYYLIEGTSKKLFSELSEYNGQQNWEKARRGLDESLHLTFILLGLIISVTISSAREILLLLYPEDYAYAAPVLMILIVANSFTALMYIFVQAMFSLSRERITTVAVFLLVGVSFFVCWKTIAWKDVFGAAIAVLIIFFTGTLLMYALLRRSLEYRFPFNRLLRIVPVCLITVGTGFLIEFDGRIMILLKLSLLSLLYLILLYLSNDSMMRTRFSEILKRKRYSG